MVARCIAGFYSHQFVLFSFIGRLLSTSEEQSEVFFSTSFKFNLRTRKLKEQKEKKNPPFYHRFFQLSRKKNRKD
jgi:hypothetical protein